MYLEAEPPVPPFSFLTGFPFILLRIGMLRIGLEEI
jgi:hypothetical protein